MTLKRFYFDKLIPTPWKNGGGITREIVSVGDPFKWRVSIARVDTDGPFSVFEGVDRTIVLLEGLGLHLKSSDGSVDQQLDQPLQMFAFSGDLHIDSRQLGGASYDFNVMARRSAGRATVTIHRKAFQVSLVERGLIYIASGQWRLQGQAGDANAELIESQDGLWWDRCCETLQFCPVSVSPAVEPALISVSWSAA